MPPRNKFLSSELAQFEQRFTDRLQRHYAHIQQDLNKVAHSFTKVWASLNRVTVKKHRPLASTKFVPLRGSKAHKPGVLQGCQQWHSSSSRCGATKVDPESIVSPSVAAPSLTDKRFSFDSWKLPLLWGAYDHPTSECQEPIAKAFFEETLEETIYVFDRNPFAMLFPESETEFDLPPVTDEKIAKVNAVFTPPSTDDTYAFQECFVAETSQPKPLPQVDCVLWENLMPSRSVSLDEVHAPLRTLDDPNRI